MKSETVESKTICGVLHYRLRCNECHGLAWVQTDIRTLSICQERFVCGTCDCEYVERRGVVGAPRDIKSLIAGEAS